MDQELARLEAEALKRGMHLTESIDFQRLRLQYSVTGPGVSDDLHFKYFPDRMSALENALGRAS